MTFVAIACLFLFPAVTRPWTAGIRENPECAEMAQQSTVVVIARTMKRR